MIKYEEIRDKIENIHGLMHKHVETSFLFDLASSLTQRNNVLEIGSFQGCSSVSLGFGAKNAGGIVFCCDLWGQQEYFNSWRQNVKDCGLSNVFPIVGSANYTLKNLEINNLGLIFIDSSHTYEDCKTQFELATRNANDGCIVAFHDYDHPRYPGVKTYCDELCSGGILLDTKIVSCTYCGVFKKT